jgi:hypothetical protein
MNQDLVVDPDDARDDAGRSRLDEHDARRHVREGRRRRSRTSPRRRSSKRTSTRQVTDLSGQVATQTECVRLQRAALAELVRISELQTENFNRTTVGSAFDTAEKRRADGITVALDEFYRRIRQRSRARPERPRATPTRARKPRRRSPTRSSGCSRS